MTSHRQPIPAAIFAFGLAGVFPFWLPALTAELSSGWASVVAVIVTLYGALILSFLGGARWGLEIGKANPRPTTIGLAMLPTLVAWSILIEAHKNLHAQLMSLAVVLLAVWLWDVRSDGLPAWYPRLRGVLTVGAVGGLLLGVLMIPA